MKTPLRGRNDVAEHVTETGTCALWEERQAQRALRIFETLVTVNSHIKTHMTSRHHFTLPRS